jgi:transposase
LVEVKGKAVAQAANRLNLKLSTAKHILKTYKEKGYLYQKKMRKNTAPE